MTVNDLKYMLIRGEEQPDILIKLKRSLRSRFERMKSLSSFVWKSNEDLKATFRNHKGHRNLIFRELDTNDTSIVN